MIEFLKLFNGLHKAMQGILIGIAGSAPFWFISIFLYERNFFNNNPLYISVIFSFSIAIGVVMTNLATAAIGIIFISKDPKVIADAIIPVGITYSIFLSAGVALINYDTNPRLTIFAIITGVAPYIGFINMAFMVGIFFRRVIGPEIKKKENKKRIADDKCV